MARHGVVTHDVGCLVQNGARPLYEKFGFVSTGRIEDGELVMSLQL
jgi:hypothetical protein